MSKHSNIPTVTSLIAPGNPRLKARAKSGSRDFSGPKYINELNKRIDELENAIGQDNKDPIGRAYAIRAESSRTGHSTAKTKPVLANRKKQTD